MLLAVCSGVGLLWATMVAWRTYRERRNPDAARLSLDLLAGGILFLLTGAFFWRTLSGDVYQPADGGDLVSFLFPTYRFAAAELSQGSLPLWNPHLYGGAPFISDIQAGFLYPPNLLLFLIAPAFSYPTMQWLAIGHLYWAGLGMYVLLRTHHFDGRPVMRAAALFGALAFQFSDALFIHLGNLNLIAVLSWLPWIMAAYCLALTRRSLAWTATTALLFTIANYAGHAQSSYYIGLALAAYTVVWLAVDVSQRRHRAGQTKTVGGWLAYLGSTLLYPAAVLVLTALLTAPILLPAMELTGYTARQDFTYQESIAYSLAPTQAAVGVLTPGFFGRGPALHWSLWDRVETPYVGIVALLLAVAGLALATKAQRRQLWSWLGMALLGMLIALGVYGIVHGILYALLPGFDQFRAPARAIVLWAFGISVLAAFGLDAVSRAWKPRAELGEAAQPQRRAASGLDTFLLVGGVLLVGVAGPLLYLALLITQGDDAHFLHASVAALAVVLAIAFWLATWTVVAGYRSERVGVNIFGPALIGLLFLELAATGAYTDISEADPTRGYHHPEIVAFLQAEEGLFRIDTRTEIQDLWQPDTAALVGLQDVGGVANPLMLRHWDRLWEATGGRQTARYDMLNVRYVIVRDGTPLPEGKFELALDAPGALSVYRNTQAMPRAWLVHDAVVVPPGSFDGADLSALFDEMGLSPASTAVIEGPIDEPLTLTPATVGNEVITVAAYGNAQMTFDVATTGAGLLVLSEVWYPGWQATVNGEPTPILRANGALRAVAVPAGASTVELAFAPSSWRRGLMVFGIGLLLAIAIALRGVRSRPQR